MNGPLDILRIVNELQGFKKAILIYCTQIVKHSMHIKYILYKRAIFLYFAKQKKHLSKCIFFLLLQCWERKKKRSFHSVSMTLLDSFFKYIWAKYRESILQSFFHIINWYQLINSFHSKIHARKVPLVLKFGFSEKATKFEKNLRRTFDKSFVFCARNSVLVKKSTIFFLNVDKSYYTNFT